MNHTAKFKEIAMGMIVRGVHVVPTYPGYRHPALPAWPQMATTDPKMVEEWGSNGYADHNCVSVAKFGGVFMLDIDDLEAAKERRIPYLPKTFTVRTPGGGIHAYFRHTKDSEMLGGYCAVKEGGEKIVEFKGHNAACCSPGCTREDGGVYRVIDDSPIVPIADELVEWLRKETVSTPKPDKFRPIRQYHPDFEREDLHDHYGWSFAKEFTKNGEDYYVFEDCPIKGGPHKNQVESRKSCLIYGKRGIRFSCFVCDEYDWDVLVEFMETEHDIEPYPYAIFADETVEEEETPESIAAFLNADPEPDAEEPKIDISDYHFRNTDTGNAERLVRKFGYRFRYVRETNEWRVWDTKRWNKDRAGMIDRAAKEVVQEIFSEAMGEQDEDSRNSKLSWAMRSEGRAQRNAMIDLAAKERSVISNTEDYDQNPWLFNCQNGTIDLKIGKLHPHYKADMLTAISPVTYDPEAKCPMWDGFVREIMGGDQEMIDFLARAAGYTLSGDTGIQAMFFLSGSGANGKGVFLEVLRHVIGGYAQDASFETFIDSKNKSEHRNDLAALAGARFVTASESQDGHRLDEALIKKLTGGDPVTCRKIYGDPFTYFPQFKIWMHSNYKPVIRGTDWGIWRRVKMIHFDVTIPDDRRDEALAAKLKAEASGVLNWMLRGLADYLKFGSMMYPAKVNEATNEYRESQDVIGQFMKAKCVVGEHCEAKQSDVYSAYRFWADTNKEYVLPERRFSEAMKKHGVKAKHKKNGNWYVGIGLLVAPSCPVNPES